SRRGAAAPPVLDPNDSTSQCVSRGCCTANFDPANVGLGSNSEVELADADFGFSPNNRHPPAA
ncbi:MAG: hypothetical protein WBW33_19300, partial [Bryobacteraceae bacterium]